MCLKCNDMLVNTVTAQKEGPQIHQLTGDLSVWTVLSCLPPSRLVHVSLSGASELAVGVGVNGCLSFCVECRDFALDKR